MRADLVIIDPQNDFCDPKGSLFVPGADADMIRLATHIEQRGDKYTQIHVTLDSHPFFHIAHPVFWVNPQGKHPDPFTIISESAVKNGDWMTSVAGPKGILRQYGLAYVAELAKNKRYPLCIWPPHCLIGSWGQSISPVLFDALRHWENKRSGRSVNMVAKGSNPYTEHYGAIQADVPDLHQMITGQVDPQTQMNVDLLQMIDMADLVGLSGEASSHCLANTARDACNFFTDDRLAKKLVFLKDASSPVPKFEQFTDDFLAELTPRGMKTSTTVDFLAV